jgi:predicted Zn-ribbon and HTH transcriptional regulator
MPPAASHRQTLRHRPLRCSECGYEIASYHATPPCPMCRAIRWEPAPWRPFTVNHPELLDGAPAAPR